MLSSGALLSQFETQPQAISRHQQQQFQTTHTYTTYEKTTTENETAERRSPTNEGFNSQPGLASQFLLGGIQPPRSGPDLSYQSMEEDKRKTNFLEFNRTSVHENTLRMRWASHMSRVFQIRNARRSESSF